MKSPIFLDNTWTFDKIEKVTEVIEDIAQNRYGLDYYTPQIEMITAPQMIQAYCSHAMPVMYEHWSFGKKYVNLIANYHKGLANLAYEVVINTDPCIAYLMESNSMTMQSLVVAHAAVGHSSFFKTNYLFQEHTNANSILDYLHYAKNYIRDCRYLHGSKIVEDLLTVCHTLQYNSVDKYVRKHVSQEKRRKQQEARELYKQQSYDPVLSTAKKERKYVDQRKINTWTSSLPEDNLLYFVENNAPQLQEWEREVVRIVRKVSQYFYPQMLTKVNNEATACMWHYTIMNDLCDEGYLTEGHRLEFLNTHCNVLSQLPYSHVFYSSINPYALGYKIYEDIRRVCENPNDEDKYFFPHLVNRDWVEVIKEMSSGHKDSSLIANYLTPNVARDMKLFSAVETDDEDEYKDPDVVLFEVDGTHDTKSFEVLRRHVANQYTWENLVPQIDIEFVDFFAVPPVIVVKAPGVKEHSKKHLKESLNILTKCEITIVED